MGAWGGGLYDSDFGRDLKALIQGVWRAPLSDDEILAEIGSPGPAGPDDIDALDHWLILADQLERAGLPRRAVFDRAIGILEAGEDLAALKALDAGEAVLARRRKVDAELLARLRDPRPAKPRRPLTRPQPLLFEVNEALAWPTEKGRCLNPYLADGARGRARSFRQDGWGFGVVTAVGHLYGVLAYHSVQALKWRRAERPSPDLAERCPRSEHHYGTMSPFHLRRLKVERLGPTPATGLGPPQDPDLARVEARRAALQNIGLSKAFGWDAHNHSVSPGPKFMFSAPSPPPLDPDEPDQHRAPRGDSNDFAPLPPDRPATRGHYLALMRARRS